MKGNPVELPGDIQTIENIIYSAVAALTERMIILEEQLDDAHTQIAHLKAQHNPEEPWTT